MREGRRSVSCCILRYWRHTPGRAGRSRSSRRNRHRQACSAWTSSRPPSRRTPASHTANQSPPRSRCSTPAGLSSRSWTCPPGSPPWRTHKPLLRRTHDRRGSARTPSRLACIGCPRSRHIGRCRAHSRSPSRAVQSCTLSSVTNDVTLAVAMKTLLGAVAPLQSAYSGRGTILRVGTAILFAISAGACTTTMYAGARRPSAEIAVISSGSGTTLANIDGTPVDGGSAASYEVLPGEHQIGRAHV